MSLQLVRVRECDGACCKASPRFPNADHTDCIYRTDPNQQRGCSLFADRTPIYGKISPSQPEKTAVQCFKDTCLNWPQNDLKPRLGKTGAECCLQWVEVR